ncbi:MAG: DinB family protein [Cytophagaceae bacterium]|jgi:hypothetical protein|nr:DinB family protein [Cytophagaceae bacterium]
MKFLFEAQGTIRSNMWKAVQALSEEQLFRIPDGYNNNLAWNLAHVVATPQILCYKLGNQGFLLPQSFIDAHKKDTSPRDWKQPVDLKEVKEYFDFTLHQCQIDYEAGKFSTFTPYTTSAGVELKSIEDALIYNYGHENLHYGVILAMRKLV